MRLKKAETNKLFFLLILFIDIHCCEFAEYHIIDTSRQELYPHDPAHPYREFMMHVWVPDKLIHSPLILFSHGLGKTYNGMTYTHLCKNIAAQGYVVVSVSHTYGCKSIQFPDGRVADYSFPIRSVHYQQSLSDVASAKLERHIVDVETEVWVADMVCALNECVQHNAREGNMLYNKIDLSRVGIVGHSLGGSTAIQVCRRDNRVAAAIDLDGPLHGNNAMASFNKPMMFIFGSSVLPSQNTSLGKVPRHYQFIWRSYFNQKWLPSLNRFISSLSSDVEVITIEGIVHDTFTDYAFTPDPIIQPWLIDGAQAQSMISEYVINFFNRYFIHS